MEELDFEIPGLDNEDVMRAQKEAQRDIKNETKKHESLSKCVITSGRLSKTHYHTSTVGEGTPKVQS